MGVTWTRQLKWPSPAHGLVCTFREHFDWSCCSVIMISSTTNRPDEQETASRHHITEGVGSMVGRWWQWGAGGGAGGLGYSSGHALPGMLLSEVWDSQSTWCKGPQACRKPLENQEILSISTAKIHQKLSWIKEENEVQFAWLFIREEI